MAGALREGRGRELAQLGDAPVAQVIVLGELAGCRG
jgi:hypothetical protein